MNTIQMGRRGNSLEGCSRFCLDLQVLLGPRGNGPGARTAVGTFSAYSSTVILQQKLSRRSTQKGFSLVELMAVVAIIGILATIGTVSYRKYINSSRSSEATTMMGKIQAAQESYKDETYTYVNCTSGDLSSSASLFPAKPLGHKTPWGTGLLNHADKTNWARLNITVPEPLVFGYGCQAGAQGAALPTNFVESTTDWKNYSPAANPWFVIEAAADFDGNDNGYAVLVTSNLTGQILTLKEAP